MERGIAPHAPRAMVQRSNSIPDSLVKRLEGAEATRLYPRLAFFEALANFKDKHSPRKQSGDAMKETRRDYLDSFAYLCDIEKGGKTVTATALQSLRESDFLWLAANEGVRDEVWDYAKTMLDMLKTTTVHNQVHVKDLIFRHSVHMSQQRIQYYKHEVETYSVYCRMELRNRERNNIVTLLRTKLKKLSEPPYSLTIEAYIDLCFDMRSNELHHLKRYSIAPMDGFARLAHYVWRLGATRAAANKVVEAMVSVPSLNRISEIRRVPAAPEAVEKKIDRTFISPQEVLYDIIADSNSENPLHCENAFRRLYQLDPPRDRPIKSKIVAREKIKTIVHAELQIADAFSRYKDRDFVAGDKYIGCSKPACYFCYLWLRNHKHDYVHPATHYKVIPGCRGPDSDLNESGAKVMFEMYRNMSLDIGHDIFQFLVEGADRRTQYMSTEASTRASSRVSAARTHE